MKRTSYITISIWSRIVDIIILKLQLFVVKKYNTSFYYNLKNKFYFFINILEYLMYSIINHSNKKVLFFFFFLQSHASGKARWIGECGLSCGPSIEEPLVPALEKLRATSWTVFNDECIERPLSYTVNNAQDLIHHHPYSITPTTIVRVENVWMWILDA